MKPIEQILFHHGPMLSSTLAERLIADYGVQPDRARKQIERGFPGMKKLGHIVFPHRARFVYREQDYGSPEFWKALTAALRATNSSYFAALGAFEQRDRILPRRHFLIACGAPIAQSGHIAAEKILAHLKQATLAREVNIPGLGECVVRNDLDDALFEYTAPQVRARLIGEQILLEAVKQWARSLNLVAYNQVQLRDEGDTPPKVGTFHWDFSAPSYLFPLLNTSKKAGPQGFVACDILLQSKVDLASVSGFLKKCSTLRNLRNVGRCLQIFIAHSYTPEAFDALKSNGVIAATSESLFGKEVARALKRLMRLLSETARRVKASPELVDFIFESLGQFEAAAEALRGSLFEYMVAEIAKSTFGNCDIDINRRIKVPSGGAAQIDVQVIVKHKAIYFIECKGNHPLALVDDDEVDQWFDQRIPTIREYIKLHPEWREWEIHCELWTSANFSDKAKQRLVKEQAKTRRYQLKFRDCEAVLYEAIDTKNDGLIETYHKHFVANPLRAHEDAQKRAARKDKRDALRKKSLPPPPPQLVAIADTDTTTPRLPAPTE